MNRYFAVALAALLLPVPAHASNPVAPPSPRVGTPLCDTINMTLAFAAEGDVQTRRKFLEIAARLMPERPSCSDWWPVTGKLIAFARDNDAITKLYAARSLRAIGSGAKDAIPVLEKMVADARAVLAGKERRVVLDGEWWGSAAHAALENISGKKYPPLQK